MVHLIVALRKENYVRTRSRIQKLEANIVGQSSPKLNSGGEGLPLLHLFMCDWVLTWTSYVQQDLVIRACQGNLYFFHIKMGFLSFFLFLPCLNNKPSVDLIEI